MGCIVLFDVDSRFIFYHSNFPSNENDWKSVCQLGIFLFVTVMDEVSDGKRRNGADSNGPVKSSKRVGRMVVGKAPDSNVKRERRSPADVSPGSAERTATRLSPKTRTKRGGPTVSDEYKKRRAPKVTEKQQEIFMEFMEKYPDFCRGKLTGFDKDQLWDVLVQMLNEAGVGPAKGVEKWKKTWADWKSGVKTKALRIHRRHLLGNNLSHHGAPEYLSPLEERMVTVAGWLFDANDSKDGFTCDEATVEGMIAEEQLVIPCFPENVARSVHASSTGDCDDDSSSPPPHEYYLPSSSNRTNSCAIVHQVPVTSSHHPFINQHHRTNREVPPIPSTAHILFTHVPKYDGDDENQAGLPSSSNKVPNSQEVPSEAATAPSNFLEIQRQHVATLAGIKRHLGTIALAHKRRAVAAERKASAMENLVTILNNFLNK